MGAEFGAVVLEGHLIKHFSDVEKEKREEKLCWLKDKDY